MSRAVKRCKAHKRNRKNKGVWKPTRPAKNKDERRSDEILKIIADMSRKFDGTYHSKNHYPKIIVCSPDSDGPGKISVDIEPKWNKENLAGGFCLVDAKVAENIAKFADAELQKISEAFDNPKCSESPSSALLHKTLEDNPIKIENASLYGSVPTEGFVFVAPDSIYLNTTENGK